MDRAATPTLLIMTQVYVPDPAAVGQHIADAAEHMARRGWRVIVYTSDRGYDDPSVRFPRRESLHGVDVRRLPLSSFGKSSIAVRLVAQVLFMTQAIFRSLLMRRVDAVLVSTSPPFAGLGGTLVSLIRGAPLTWWVMDINPDQMVSAGRLSKTSLLTRLFDVINRIALHRARHVVVLDRFMRDRMLAKLTVPEKISIVGPWAHEDKLEPVAQATNPFRSRHGLTDKFVVMYSGNHGFQAPLATLLAAAKQLHSVPNLVFAFVGGGVMKKEINEIVERDHPSNIVSLPYQPIDSLRYSLSAADIHVVSIANAGVGVIHPCKIYGAMAVGRPILALGPKESHAADLVVGERIGWICEHGDVNGLAELLRGIAATPPAELTAMGSRAVVALHEKYSRQRALDTICDLVAGCGGGSLMEQAA
jgi:glycosyltransferase involved in cell wall biosynthesis